MQHHPAYSQPPAALPELGGAVSRPHAAQVWKQRTRCGQLAKQCCDFRAEV